MTIQLGETAPDFTAETTEGRLNFHEYLVTTGGCCSPIRRTSPRSAPLNSGRSPTARRVHLPKHPDYRGERRFGRVAQELVG
jgi:hypothetical protein